MVHNPPPARNRRSRRVSPLSAAVLAAAALSATAPSGAAARPPAALSCDAVPPATEMSGGEMRPAPAPPQPSFDAAPPAWPPRGVPPAPVPADTAPDAAAPAPAAPAPVASAPVTPAPAAPAPVAAPPAAQVPRTPAPSANQLLAGSGVSRSSLNSALTADGVPNLLGDLLHSTSSVTFPINLAGDVAGLDASGTLFARSTKVSENNTALPRTRFSARHNWFHNAPVRHRLRVRPQSAGQVRQQPQVVRGSRHRHPQPG